MLISMHNKLLPTILLIPSGYRNRLYKESTVSSGKIGHDFCKSIGPVSRPSSAQNIENPASLSPFINVLQKRQHIFNYEYYYKHI